MANTGAVGTTPCGNEGDRAEGDRAEGDRAEGDRAEGDRAMGSFSTRLFAGEGAGESSGGTGEGNRPEVVVVVLG